MLEQYFKLSDNKTTLKTEIIADFTTLISVLVIRFIFLRK
jgi:xanthine/uracil/vitamin C permease (AzgA family)